ncbi:MAG: precorrin-6A/cobalt-precorrin-6A reductase, partial [Eubacteriales bacterium]
MSEICVFAGTSEGRRLLEFLAGQPVGVLACVATDYGEALVPHADNIEVSARRLDGASMRALFAGRSFDLVI